MTKTPIQYHEDDRAQRYLNVFYGDIIKQVNVSFVSSTKHIVAWHKHEIQKDYWVCLKGAFKVGLAIPDYSLSFDNKVSYNIEWRYLSDKHPTLLIIPPGVYHGYKALQPNSILLYGFDHSYNPTDEYREEVGAFGENWETENK